MEKLKNKKAVITGGSRGIGKAIAEEYLQQGAEVFLAARNIDELKAVQKELDPSGSKVHIASVDVSKKEDIEGAAQQITSLWGGLDILVNAAGVYGPIGPITEVDPAEWRSALEINLFGTFLAIHTLVPLMKNGGSIINFVGGGEGAYPNFSSYVSAKGGIARLTETVAAELALANVRANAIAPGAVNTKFLDDIIAAGPGKTGKATYEKSIKQKESGGISPEKAAKLCVFLAADDSKGLSGKILSAVWDNYEDFPKHLDAIMASDVYTFRRVRPTEA